MLALSLDKHITHLLTPDQASTLMGDLAYNLALHRIAQSPFSGRGHVLGHSTDDNIRRDIIDAEYPGD